MKTPSPDLFDLVKSLTPSEKKHFKQYASRYSEARESGYMQLFDAIDAQKEYNEEAIKTKFKGRAFVKQLSVAKNYLYERILDALVSIHSETDEHLYLDKLIGRVEVLKNKNLMTAALSAYEKAEKIAVELGRLPLLPHISRQRNQITSRIEKRFQHSGFIANAENSLQHGKVLVNFLEYELLSIKANVLFGDPAINSDPAVMQQLNELMQHPLFSSESLALSLPAWYFYTRTWYRYLTITRQHDKGYTLLKNSVSYMLQRPANNQYWQISYYNLFIDLLYLCFGLRKYTECKTLLQEYPYLIEKKYSPRHAIIHDQFRFTLHYSVETATGLNEALALWEQKRDWWRGEINRMEPSTYFNTLFFALKLYFLKGDWKNTIAVFNDLTNNKFLWNIHLSARIYWLMLQYEIANLEILKSQTLNISEWFKKNNVTTEGYKTIFSYFKKLPQAAGKEERTELFIRFKEAIQQQTAGDNVDVYYDLLCWVEAHLNNLTFAQVVAGKAAQAISASPASSQ